MIFKTVTELDNKTDKSFFIELISVYIRLVQVYCEKYNIDFCSTTDEISVIKEMTEIGVISSANDINILRIILKEKYDDFYTAVGIVIEHKKEIAPYVEKLNNSRRKFLQKKNKDKKPKLVDFFCGAGGLSLGFVQEGFNVVLANDIEDVCIQTYKYNHPELPSDKVIQGDIRQIVENIEDYVDNDVDVVVGGPPCQGFSEANRQRIIDDPRNKLYKFFVKAVEKIGPKVVVMENVKGMLKVADQVVEDYQSLRVRKDGKIYSYKVAYKILNSHDFSVAQSRERLIYIAVRNDIMEHHDITPETIFENIDKDCKKNPCYYLQDAIADIKKLDAPRVKNCNEVDNDKTGKKIDVNDFEQHNNEYLNKINCGRKIPFLYNHKARFCSDVNYEIYKRLNQGDDATDEKIKDIMPYAHRNHCFKDKYFKLIADKPCRTITAHLRMDCHSHIHPYQIRSLTPREAARVQSFPDDYLFLGAYLKTYMQIGNAVPTMMARGIAKSVKKYLV